MFGGQGFLWPRWSAISLPNQSSKWSNEEKQNLVQVTWVTKILVLCCFFGGTYYVVTYPDIWGLLDLDKRLFQNTYEATRIPWNVTPAKELKSRSRGYASMDYRIIDYRTAIVCWQPVNLKKIQQSLCKQKWCGQIYRTDTEKFQGILPRCAQLWTLWCSQGLTIWWNWRPGSSVGEKFSIHIRKLRSPTTHIGTP